MRGEDKSGDDTEATAKAIRAGDRVALARAITLIESAKREDQAVSYTHLTLPTTPYV